MYVERVNEINILKTFYDDPEQKVAAVYGRYGMGKTTLLRHFSEGRKTVFFTAYSTTDKEEVRLFANALGKEDAESLEEVLDAVTALSEEGKTLLIMDHYPDFVKADASFEKILYTYVTENWKEKDIKVILCGDSYLHMEKYVLGKKSVWKSFPLFTMEVGPMDFRESRSFFDKHSSEEILFLYGLTGGIPYHLNKVQGLSLDQAITETYLVSSKGGCLRPEDTMSIELRENAYYNRMLSTLAKGLLRVNQMSQAVGKPKDVVVPYMNTLMGLGMVTKDTAITEKTNRKKTRYSIVNTGDLFWYHFIADNMKLFYDNDVEGMLKVIHDRPEDYLQEVFIRLCKEYLITMSAEGKMPFTIDEIGNWWENDEEKGTSFGFDLVALGHREDKDATIYGRCYYGTDPIEIHQLKELIDMTKKLKRDGDVFYMIFSKAGFHENAMTVSATIKNIMLVTLDEVVKF